MILLMKLIPFTPIYIQLTHISISDNNKVWKQKLNIFGRRIGATIILSSFRFPFKSVHYEVKLNGKPHTEYNALMKQKLDDLFQRYKYRRMNA